MGSSCEGPQQPMTEQRADDVIDHVEVDTIFRTVVQDVNKSMWLLINDNRSTIKAIIRLI